MEIKELMKKATMFHGHICPGIAIGVLVAKYALENGFEHSPDEELVAVVETDNCSVDALQTILGTTYGKGNLIHKDYGKSNYNIYSRKNQKGVRLSLKKTIFDNKKLSRDEKIQNLLSLEPENVFEIRNIEYDPPGMAQIEESLPCSLCGELTMESRMMNYQGKIMCIPCYKEFKQ
ncbi:MAG: TraR/DksA C4-type zinc finger protein [Candidatus Lokiarchaeota archaeon]|nr:TraR/DksA C4-type zinc finger protein [Candidatus Lokiarchaeota archaeon]